MPIAAMDDLLLGPIVGNLGPDRVNLWGRARGSGILYGWIGKTPNLSDALLAGKSLQLSAADGFAGVVPLGNLLPETRYYYALTLNDQPPDSSLVYPQFTTSPPDGQPTSFAFSFGSCFLPANEQGGQIFNALEMCRQQDCLRFILMIGDQIYADDYKKNGIGKIACTLEDYRSVYEYTWSRPPFRSLLANLPAFMILDDHEVDDDWRWLDRERQWAYTPWWNQIVRWVQGRPPQERLISPQRVQNALQAYWEHQAMHAPPMLVPPPISCSGQYDIRLAQQDALAYTFNFGAASFFVLDTRTQRVKYRGERVMLGNAQWQLLESWLLDVKDSFPVKFLVSSCASLFDMWVDIPQDRWCGFPEERKRLLNFLATNGIEGVYVLAGDLHSAHAVRVELKGPQGQAFPLWEFCSTPFEQKPNWLSRFSYYAPYGLPVSKQQRFFTIARANFGIVRVNFSGDYAQVSYEVHGEHGELVSSVQAA